MTLRIYRILQAFILLGLGGLLFQKFFTGRLYYYINERFFYLVVLAAAGFFVLGFVLLESRTEQHDHGDHEHAHHDHAAGSKPSALVIAAIPLLLGLLIPAKPLDANVVESRGISTGVLFNANQTQAGIELNAPADQRTILDWIRAFNYSDNPAEFAGQTADVIGFVYHDPRLPAHQFLIGRLAITCCVADAFAIGMVVESPQADEMVNNTWMHVRGEVQVVEMEAKSVPLIIADSIKETDPPAQPYLFP